MCIRDSIGTDESASTSSWQLFYEGEVFDGNLLAQVGYSFDQNVGLAIGTVSSTADREGYSIAAAWKPADAGIVPSISTGYSAADVEDVSDDVESWYVGLEWSSGRMAPARVSRQASDQRPQRF